MEFSRDSLESLLAWKTKVGRKPLLLMGARQIGKTTLLQTFGQRAYDDVLYINFEKDQEVHRFFEGNKSPQPILDNLSLIHGTDLKEESSLIILDEIQECRDALIALKYFQEELPNIHIVAAGSLLGLSIGNDRSFPVGKVEFLEMFPLTFEEYLRASDQKLYKAYEHFSTQKEINPIPEAFFSPLNRVHKEYLLFGGMPEVASHFIQHRDIESAQEIQDQILMSYALDFVKHASKTTSTKIQRIWNAIPSQLAKENKKFLYKAIRTGAKAREYEEAIQWLVQAGLLYQTSLISTPSVPLKAYEDVTAFKMYVFETGLLMRLAGLDPSTFTDGSKFFTQFKGALAENFVCQTLRRLYGRSPYYWTSAGKAELDFLIEQSGLVIPIEVKSGLNTKAKSLATYQKKYAPHLRIRVSNQNLSLSDNLLNIPMCLVERVTNIVGGLT